MRNTPPDGDTVAALPPGAETCAGIPWPGHVRPQLMCQTCLRWQSAHIPGPQLTPTVIYLHTTVWCQDRIGT